MSRALCPVCGRPTFGARVAGPEDVVRLDGRQLWLADSDPAPGQLFRMTNPGVVVPVERSTATPAQRGRRRPVQARERGPFYVLHSDRCGRR